eukprot:06241.XXX_34464_34754_1 [CDS] Oithona nana genome sequencing.
MKNSTAGANLLEKRKEKICLNALKNHVKNDERENLDLFFFTFWLLEEILPAFICILTGGATFARWSTFFPLVTCNITAFCVSIECLRLSHSKSPPF